MRETASRLGTLIANLRVGILIEDEKRQILVANQAFCDLFHLAEPPSHLMGKSSAVYIEQAKLLFLDPDGFLRRTEELAASDTEGTNETLYLADGRILKRDYIPVYVDGTLSERMWLYRDISERQQLQRRMKVYEGLSAAVEQTADTVFITDRQGHIEYVNPAFESTTGYGKHEVLGLTPRILKSGRHDAEFYRKLWTQVLSGQAYKGTIVNKKKTGELYSAQQTITPMRDEDGKVTHFVAVLRDITDLLKRNEQEVEMRLAREVQQRFYRDPSSIPGYDIGGVACPANETGGDYFDFIPMPDGYVGIAIGDVSGHGLRCALVMAEVRAYLRSFASTSSDVAWILTRVNRALEPDLERGDFVTLLLVRLDPVRRTLVYANAGHIPPGYLLGSTGQIDAAMIGTGPPLGVLPDYEYTAGDTLSLHPGQILLLMTDGVTESLTPEQPESGEARAIEYVISQWNEPARAIAQGLCHMAQTNPASQPQQDDITSVVLRVSNITTAQVQHTS